MMIFALLLFTLMIMMGGLALDLMRYETIRVNLQQTIDRSTLAAAALDQTLDPESVVRDYMTKAGLADQISSITVTDGGSYRSVQTEGVAATTPFFLPMMGINNLDAHAGATAEQGLSNIEIVLVLDVSGSMTGQKIASLKVAADNFVDTVFAQDVDHRVSVSIVPYNAQVNLPVALRDVFNATHVNDVANDNCAELPPSVYATAAIPLTTPLPMMAYADTRHNTDRSDVFVAPTDSRYAVPNYASAYCRPTSVNLVRLPSTDPTTLKSEIDALQAGGNTSITLGMKWGMTLLDPSLRPAFDGFVTSGTLPTTIAGRPFDYTDNRAMKVIVLMTDGEHVAHDRVTDAYKTGPSGIYKSLGDGLYSIRFTAGRPAVAGSSEYYVPHLDAWQATPWNSGAGAVEQDWKDIWANLRTSYVAWQFYARALGTSNSGQKQVYNARMADMVQTYASATDMDATLQQTCQQARNENVLVFGIAVEAPTHGQDEIRNCATTPAHYFDASSSTLDLAFQSIATNITQLKLTQ